MKYNSPELIERLSAEYVLGTLQGKARDRFHRLMETSNRVRLAVWAWETRIAPLALVTPEAKSPLHNWVAIKARLGFGRETNNPVTSTTFWRWWGLCATAASLLLAVMLVTRPPVSNDIRPQETAEAKSAIDRIALFSNNQAEPQWLVSFDMEAGQLRAKALNPIAVEAGRVFELWVLPQAGDPRSLGLLPVSQSSEVGTGTTLPLALMELLRGASGLAISIEPEGGSPTGLPTGPVIAQSPLLAL